MDAEPLSLTLNKHPLVSLVSACFWVILWLLTWAKSLVAFATITIPRWLYAIVSYSMTLTLGFWNFVALFILSAVGLNYLIRFRYLNDYMKLNEAPLEKPDVNELHPDVNTNPTPASFHNYLDDFLQAVRVFGFLEKPVFHELARHLQTRRLIAGDTLSLNQDKSFYCVVDGMVQVYAQSGHQPEVQGNLWDSEDMNGYQLLNEVGTSSPKDIPMSWQDDDHGPSDATSSAFEDGTSLRQTPQSDTDIPPFDLGGNPVLSEVRQRRHSTSSVSTTSTSTLNVPGGMSRSRRSSMSPSVYEEAESHFRSSASNLGTPRPQGAHTKGVLARATVDTTLAVIPAEAFRRLTKKYPKATGHIVQVILTRFFRVTFTAAHKYLGLTSEVLRTEKAINEIACHPLPGSFYEGGGLQYLRHRFDGTGTSPDAEAEYFDFAQTPGTFNAHSRENTSVPTALPKINETPVSIRRNLAELPSAHKSRLNIQAGDLMMPKQSGSETFKMKRSNSILNTPGVRRSSDDTNHGQRMNGGAKWSAEDFDLREEVMSCIAKSIGLLQPSISDGDSNEHSPALPPVDSRRSVGSFSSPFGSLSLLDLEDDMSSVTASSALSAGNNSMSGLDNEVEILFFPAGSTLVKAAEQNTGLFYVIEGFLDILLPEKDEGKDESAKANKIPEGEQVDGNEDEPWRTPSLDHAKKKPPQHKFLFTVKPGGIAGYLASLCSTSSYVDIKAKTDTYVGFLSSQALERILEKRPIVLLTLAKRLISMISPLILHIDASLDWMQINAGQVLWRPNDISDSFYIVINGRLRAISEGQNGKVKIEGEYGQGDTVGELDVITSSPRRNTVHAIRDTELVRMPQTLFNRYFRELLKMIASRVRAEVDSSSAAQARNPASELGHNNTNLKTVAILPVSRSVPVATFARKLQTALEGIGASTLYLNQAAVSQHLGKHAFTRMGKLKSAGWLADQEQRYHTVLYVADSPVNSSWTQTCIRQADCVMVVGMGDDPSPGEYERLLLSMKTTARKELVLLHPDRSVVPGSTREWLKNRPWVHQHIHVELPGLVIPISKSPAPKDPDAVIALKNLKDKVQSELQKYRRGPATDIRPTRQPHTNDFSRLARRICGKSIGLVLGGGGARGIAHLGLLQALEEYGIPIDHIGGTSIGAFIGGLYAREADFISSTGRAKQFSGRMGNIWRILSDVTYPLVAYTTGHEFNRSLYKAFFDLHIEDMWLPFFCNSTNIITSRMEIHETGYAWRYIRASMTLVGLLPPLSDNGNLLVDGGYLDNLPVHAMNSMGASAVFACDVASIDDNSPRRFGDTVSGWWLLINRWNPFSNARHVPAITEIQSRLAYVSSVNTLEEAKVAKNCLYIQMPVQEYGTLQFNKFEELVKIGYQHAVGILDKLEEEHRLPSSIVGEVRKKKGKSARRNSI
ncbi:hydrolase [Coprinellus micaceus]|uniref:Lysophospholipase NTE1 n=1 Tax=Coprinellus micaceus TaxID=71717 RepID=A0A4Y7TXD7_COPMI|nr:hydrolase [Coprinellus micaceus]